MENLFIRNPFLKFGIYASLSLVLLTIITFGFAMIAIPPAGPYCPGDCMEYPFKELLAYYPRDYYWMYLAVFQLFAFIIFTVSNHFIANFKKKLYSALSAAFALISTTVLLITYFTQFAIIPISMMKGETEGIALLTQYNGHGLFIALEELGYITMSISLLFLAFVFTSSEKFGKIIRYLLLSQFLLNLISFIAYSVIFGIDRDYRFEVASITIDWLSIIIAGILISLSYKHQLKTIKSNP